MLTGLTESLDVTVEPGEPGVIGLPGVVTVPWLPGVVGGTEYRIPDPGSRSMDRYRVYWVPAWPGHVQSTLVGRPVTAEPTFL